MAKTVVFTFGRMNPPTIGHEKLANKVKAVAKKYGGEPRIYMSHSQDAKSNPLDYNLKTKVAQQAFGIVKKSKAKQIIQISKELEKEGVKHMVVVVGSDRYTEFKTLLNKYNGKEYKFDKIDIESAGQRDPDAEGVEGMSGTKLRALAKDGDMKTFMKGLASKMSNANKKKVYDTLRSVMKEETEIELTDADIDMYEWDDDELDAMEVPKELEFFVVPPDSIHEILTVQQRKAIGRRMKRLAPRMQRKKKIAQKRMATPQKLIKRANAAALNILRKKMAGAAGAKYSELSPQQKVSVDKRIEKKKATFVQKMRARLMPKIKKKEMERLKMARTSKSENLNISVGAFLDEAKKPMFVAIDPKTGKKVGEFKNKREADAAKKKNRKLDILTMKDYAMMTEAKFKADVEGIGTIYVDGGSASGVKAQLKKVVKKGDLIKSVDRIQKGEYKKELRALMKGDEDKGEVDEIARSMTPMKDKFGSGKKLKLKDFKVGMFVQGKGGKVGKITANEPRADQIVVKWNKGGTDELPIKGLGLYTKPRLQGLVMGEELTEGSISINSLPFKALQSVLKDMLSRMKGGDRAKMEKELNKVMRSLGVNEETQMYIEGRMKELHGYIEQGKDANWIAKKMKLDVKTIKALMPEAKQLNFEARRRSGRADAMRALRRDKDIGRRGKDSADVDDTATDSDVEAGMKNFVMQLRKVISLRGLKPVEFADGKKKKLSTAQAQAALQKYNSMRTSIDKGKWQAKASKSYSDFLKSIKEEYDINMSVANLIEHGSGDHDGTKKKSKHTIAYHKKYGENDEGYITEKQIDGLKKKAEKSGIPYGILKKVYDRGMAAWKSGHRPGAGQHQWAFARVNSFITKGKGTWGGADKDLAAKVRG